MNECSCLLLSILYVIAIGDSMQEVSQIWAALGSSGAASGDGGGRKQSRFTTAITSTCSSLQKTQYYGVGGVTQTQTGERVVGFTMVLPPCKHNVQHTYGL